MAKNDYISDNLITMRDRLRESTTALREAAEQKRAEAAPAAAPPAPAQTPGPAPSPAAGDRADWRTADGLRAKQDLAARLARDSARLEKMLAELDARCAEFRRCQNALARLADALAALSPQDPSGRFAAETDRLRLEYFRLCGTLDALAPTAGKTSSADRGRTDQELAKKVSAAAWIVGLAMLAAAGIVAGVIAAVFQ